MLQVRKRRAAVEVIGAGGAEEPVVAFQAVQSRGAGERAQLVVEIVADAFGRRDAPEADGHRRIRVVGARVEDQRQVLEILRQREVHFRNHRIDAFVAVLDEGVLALVGVTDVLAADVAHKKVERARHHIEVSSPAPPAISSAPPKP